MLKKIILGISALAATSTIAVTDANAGHRHRGYDRGYYSDGYYDGYYRDDRRYRRGYAHRGYDGGYYRRGDRHYYGRRRCGSGTTGAILGGAAGALLGREIDRGGRRGYYGRRGSGTTGLILGGAAGALLGREIGRRC